MSPDAFKTIRTRCGHTQASLAAFLRVTARQIQMIESGKRNPSGPMTVLMEMLGDGKI